MTDSPLPALGGKPTLIRVLRDQSKIIGLAGSLVIADILVLGVLGEWMVAVCLAGGIALGLANHIAGELWLLKVITSGEELTRNQMAGSTLVRLLTVTVVAVGIAVALWPVGLVLLIGLALFRAIALVMTSVPLLKELRKV